MKTKIISFIDKLPKSVILCTISGLLITSAINMYTLKVETDSIHKIENLVDDNVNEIKKSYITSSTNLGYKLCKQTTDLLAKKLENELLTNYDLNTLQKEFEKSVLSDKFYNTIKDVLSVKSDDNILFNSEKITMVALKSGIIAEFSNIDKQLESNTKVLSWEEYINNSINPQLTKDALDIVLNSKNDIAFIQKSGECVLSESEISDLVDLYLKEGKSVLKDYYFITSSFITEDGDIFGTSDKTFLATNDNYKLIILNATNVLEVIEQLFETELESIESNGNKLLIRIDGYNDLRQLSSILGNIIIFISAIGMITIYNKKVK